MKTSEIREINPSQILHLVQNRENVCTRILWHIQCIYVECIICVQKLCV